MKYLLTFLILILVVLKTTKVYAAERFFEIQSIDTMKFSRDTAGAKLDDPTFDTEIETQIKNIAATGATHVAVGTPYDEKFVPFLARWVKFARKYKLKVWFRGNMSAWEGWFDIPKKMDQATHTKMVEQFILNHPELFEDGDIFVSCPECENGASGDPRQTGDVTGYRNFLINEYTTVKNAFSRINKKVRSNFYSMNGDVARLIMDKKTTKALDGVITIDHYVKDSDQLIKDIDNYASQSGGKVVLGEWGAPIPDIHGEMTQEEQAAYIDDTFKKLIINKNISGINYWVNRGGSTVLWEDDNTPRKGVEALSKYYSPVVLNGTITDTQGRVLHNVTVSNRYNNTTAKQGQYTLAVVDNSKVEVSVSGYQKVTFTPKIGTEKRIKHDVVLKEINESFIQRLRMLFLKIAGLEILSPIYEKK